MFRAVPHSRGISHASSREQAKTFSGSRVKPQHQVTKPPKLCTLKRAGEAILWVSGLVATQGVGHCSGTATLVQQWGKEGGRRPFSRGWRQLWAIGDLDRSRAGSVMVKLMVKFLFGSRVDLLEAHDAHHLIPQPLLVWGLGFGF